MYKIQHLERKWIFQKFAPVPPQLGQVLPYSELILQTLVHRGYTTPEKIFKFIDYNQYTPASAYDLPDMDKGIQRITLAIRRNEKIGVWGDFDVDGQTSTAILTSTLRELRAVSAYHIPVRGPESHGIGMNALREFLSTGVKVILTCDTGITAHEPIAYAQSLGIDVVVTDHHLLSETLPPAYAVINPHRLPTSHPLSTLPGAGTALKFAEALLDNFSKSNSASHLHDLAALGIIADLAELRKDARYLVQSGIDQIRCSTRPALAAMLEIAGVNPANLTEEQVSFIIAPRLNAVGRLSDANPIVEFLLTDNASQIAVRVNQIEGLNQRRKLLCDQVFAGAQSLIEQDPSVLNYAVLILHHPDWPAGVIGIVASRLVEIYHRPVILLSGIPDQPLRGSARSVAGADITSALRRCEALLISYGGHPMAAGLALNSQEMPALLCGLDSAIKEMLASSEEEVTLMIDQVISPTDITLDLARSLDLLAPYGPGNPPLVLSANDMQLIDSRPIGKQKEHLLVDVEDSQGNQNRLIWWNGSGLPLPDGRFDLAYTPRASNYRGEDQVSLEWVDYRLVNDQIDLKPELFKKPIVNIDLRNSSEPIHDIAPIQDNPETLVLLEGSAKTQVQAVNRQLLKPCHDLVIWSVPPDLETLRTILKITNPERVYWLLVSPPEHRLPVFLRQVAALVRNSLIHGISHVELSSLSTAVAAAEATTDIAVRWLSARGDITITGFSNGEFRVDLGGTPTLEQQKLLEDSLLKIFQELNSFTRYLQQVDLDQLTSDLR